MGRRLNRQEIRRQAAAAAAANSRAAALSTSSPPHSPPLSLAQVWAKKRAPGLYGRSLASETDDSLIRTIARCLWRTTLEGVAAAIVTGDVHDAYDSDGEVYLEGGDYPDDY